MLKYYGILGCLQSGSVSSHGGDRGSIPLGTTSFQDFPSVSRVVGSCGLLIWSKSAASLTPSPRDWT